MWAKPEGAGTNVLFVNVLKVVGAGDQLECWMICVDAVAVHLSRAGVDTVGVGSVYAYVCVQFTNR